MNDVRVLVTGASGYVGNAVAAAFRGAGAAVTAVDSYASDDVQRVDVTDHDQIAELVGDGGFEVIAHLAASAVGSSGLVASARTDPMKAVDVNVAGTAQLAHLANEVGVRRFLYASSTTVYGPRSMYPGARVTENAAFRPATFYGATKASAEHLGRCLLQDSPVDFVAIRLPLIYGAEKWYGGALTMLMDVVRAVKAGEPVDAEVPSFETDWLHVHDAADVFVAAAKADEVADAYHVVGHTGSMLGLAERVSQLLPGSGVSLRPASTDESLEAPLTDDSLARQDLKFRPMCADVHAAAASFTSPEGSDAADMTPTTERGSRMRTRRTCQ